MRIDNQIEYKCVRCSTKRPLNLVNNNFYCSECSSEYPIINNLPRFVSSEIYADTFGFEWNYFSKTQLDSANGTTQSRDTFITKTGWTLEELRGKKILDAGCGMGRFSAIAASAGAEVHAIDLSSAVEAAFENLKQYENVRVFQADIFNLPFFDETFDYIFSIGVLHHTPSTEKAFKALTRFLKKGGKISIWVYSKKLLRKIGLSQLYRKITIRFPEELRLKLCRIAGPLYYVHKIPIFGKVSHFFLPISIHPNLEWRILDTFDWYSPKYQMSTIEIPLFGWRCICAE